MENNSSHGLISIALSILIIGGFAVHQYFQKQDRELKIKENEIEFKRQKEVETSTKKNQNEILLRLCFEDAEAEYRDFFIVNSDDTGQKSEDGSGVRRWKSAEFEETAEDNLKTDKEFCIRRFSD